jgi:hypothetical protein
MNGISYVVLQANAAYGNDVSYHNQYAIVDVYADGRNMKVAVARSVSPTRPWTKAVTDI